MMKETDLVLGSLLKIKQISVALIHKSKQTNKNPWSFKFYCLKQNSLFSLRSVLLHVILNNYWGFKHIALSIWKYILFIWICSYCLMYSMHKWSSSVLSILFLIEITYVTLLLSLASSILVLRLVKLSYTYILSFLKRALL